MQRSEFHGESVSAASGAKIKIYLSGSLTEHTLADDEVLYVTDLIYTGPAGSVTIVADSAGAGRYMSAATLTDEVLTHADHFSVPYECPAGTKPAMINDGQGDTNTLLVQGYIHTTP